MIVDWPLLFHVSPAGISYAGCRLSGALGKWDIPVWHGRFADKRPRTVPPRYRIRPHREPRDQRGDVNREDDMLGWGHHDETMFEAVLDVAGHHFDVFAQDRIYVATAAIQHGREN
ncbi:hypothetical protein TOPH_07902 [Tolypocladium ophioglossoides CBS 100239]|uniref:Uncharacterized protein n=1 Tax=Tolypocladium ophioglossoides (strain CBS 100239) TaxID=1163406 RepID=A0A0L0MZV0_TOLOC|nr:hypothetical protein TOPH_07902 [Tolypocladium ophioglossoides CBS 100239]